MRAAPFRSPIANFAYQMTGPIPTTIIGGVLLGIGMIAATSRGQCAALESINGGQRTVAYGAVDSGSATAVNQSPRVSMGRR